MLLLFCGEKERLRGENCFVVCGDDNDEPK